MGENSRRRLVNGDERRGWIEIKGAMGKVKNVERGPLMLPSPSEGPLAGEGPSIQSVRNLGRGGHRGGRTEAGVAVAATTGPKACYPA